MSLACQLARILIEARLAVGGAEAVREAGELHQCVERDGYVWQVELESYAPNDGGTITGEGRYHLVRIDPLGSRSVGGSERFTLGVPWHVEGLAASDIDGDGAPDALVVEHHQEYDPLTDAWVLHIVTVRASAQEDFEPWPGLHLTSFGDLDDDGRVDVFGSELEADWPGVCAMGVDATGPVIVLHALARGYTTDDGVARALLAKTCPRKPALARDLRRFERATHGDFGHPIKGEPQTWDYEVAVQDAQRDALGAVVRSIGCARIWGATPDDLKDALDRVFEPDDRQFYDWLYATAQSPMRVHR